METHVQYASDTEHHERHHGGDHKQSPSTSSHQLPPDDPENPMNWPILEKIYVCLVATSFAFTVAFGLTSYAVSLSEIMTDFGVSMTVSIVPFSIYLVGIAFAPIYTPHLSERLGRSRVYYASLPLCALFILGASRSQSFASLAVCRFFAGFCGGPCLVLIEGTFADVWSGSVTVSYYSFLTLASYIGAACGPIICGFVFASKGWRWTQYVTLMLALASYLFGIGMPETYSREILRRRARRLGRPHRLPPAESGVTLPEMAKITLLTPITMLFTEPVLVAFTTLYVCFLFGTVFQWFIAVPAVLMLVYNFSIAHAGLAFIAAVVGAVLAAATATAIDRLAYHRAVRKSRDTDMVDIEYRLIPAMVGGVLMTASLFWIGWTASPTVSWASPVVGTSVFVWGNALGLISAISYLFDAYPPAATLSALTVAASMRLLTAAAIPLCIIPMITNLGGWWAYGTFGFISVALAWSWPCVMFWFGKRLRGRSRYSSAQETMGAMEGIEAMSGHEEGPVEVEKGAGSSKSP